MASPRLEQVIHPFYRYTDELRMVGRHGAQGWGGMALFRGEGDRPFTAEEVAYVGSLSGAFAAGLRSGLLVRLAAPAVADPATGELGPAVAIVDARNQLTQVSVGATRLLAEMASDPNMADASGVVASLVAGARRFVTGATDILPRCRVRLPSGRWLVLHASPLSSVDGRGGDVVITMEEARPPEIVPLVVAAFQLTDRERDVTQLVLQGVDTKEIAATLHLSRYTVQDHLKSVFDKADVRSRRELVARVYFDQYVPRMGGDLAPSGWFASST
jgi:DNA-binding CsgD family transcriptional regulator